MADPATIIHLLQSRRINLTTEKAVQADIEVILRGAGIAFEREAFLSKQDQPDFLITETGLVLEAKIKGAKKMAVFRQLERYAAHERVSAVMLVTNLAMGLPAVIGGKPAYYASLGRAWL